MLPNSLPASPSKALNEACKALAGASSSTSQRGAVLASGAGYNDCSAPICQADSARVPSGGAAEGGGAKSAAAGRFLGSKVPVTPSIRARAAPVLIAIAGRSAVAIGTVAIASALLGGAGCHTRTPISRSMANCRLPKARLIAHCSQFKTHDNRVFTRGPAQQAFATFGVVAAAQANRAKAVALVN